MMNKRGQEEPTGTNLIKLIIAVAGVVLVLIVIGIMLKTYFGDIPLEKAASSLDYIIREAESVPVGESRTITITTPVGWWLSYFNDNENVNAGGFEKPDALFGRKVLCVCKEYRCNSKACKETSRAFKKDDSSLMLKIKVMDVEIFNKLEYFEFKVLE